MSVWRAGVGRRLRRRSLVLLAAVALLLMVTGTTRVMADEPTSEATPTPDDTSAPPTPEPVVSTPADAATAESAAPAAPGAAESAVPETAQPAATHPAAGQAALPGAPSTTPEPLPQPAVVVTATPGTAAVVTSTVEPGSGDPAPPAGTGSEGAGEGHEDGPSTGASAQEQIATEVMRSGAVERLISGYVESVVREAVVDSKGRPTSCFCAVSVSVSLDGPTNAVATLGRVTSAATGSGSGSGRSGDATALSVTGDGSATATATSGDTGAVSSGGTGTSTTAGGASTRTATIDVAGISSALRSLVQGLGAEMAIAADADTSAHVADLLSGVSTTASGAATVEVATWDRAAGSARSGSGDSVSCEPYDGTSNVPSCAVAIAVTAGGGAQASVLPPRLPTGTTSPATSSVGAPGMATAVSVAVSGPAVSAARTGDAGVRVPRAAVQAQADPGGQAATARSGSSGSSVAVALTVRGASATAARSGDTGSALSTVLTTPAELATSSYGSPGSGGSATARAHSGDTGSAWAITAGGTGASGESRSGDTGDAAADTTPGGSGHDWSDGVAGAGSGQVTGGSGGAADASAVTGRSGSSLSLVISGGSAVATATSGPSGDSNASAAGGRGGDTHAAGSGEGQVRSGDGGAGTGAGLSGDTGNATAILVTPYDGTAGTRSGHTGNVRAFARGGDAGCASRGIDPAAACRPPLAPASPAGGTGGQAAVEGGVGSTTGSPDSSSVPSGATGSPKPADDVPAAARSAADAPSRAAGSAPDVTVDVRSRGSADVTCVAEASSRTCRSADTPPVRAGDSVAGGADRGEVTVTRLDSSGSGHGGVQPAGSSGTPVSRSAPLTKASGPSVLALLINAAVPVLALLSLVAMVLTSRRRRALRVPQHIGKHRRKQPLPSVSTRHR